MSDKEILEVLKEMLADYEAALIFKLSEDSQSFGDFISAKKLGQGFCFWLKSSIYKNSRVEIFLELTYDLNISRSSLTFYPTPFEHFYKTIEEIKRISLLPRAKHLIRTIERLEKEILENITVTMPQQI